MTRCSKVYIFTVDYLKHIDSLINGRFEFSTITDIALIRFRPQRFRILDLAEEYHGMV